MNIKDILKVTKGELLIGSESTICENFSTDSRNIKTGDVYIALNGEKFEGNNFYKNAIQNGATTCIISCDVDEKEKSEFDNVKVNIIKVSDTLRALQQIATYKRSLYNIPVVAVTGSVGKTSTKDLIAGVMAKKFKVLKTEGNQNNDIGLPLTLLKLKDQEAIVIEMGMNHFGEIRLLTNIAKPTVAIITNIGTAHIGNLGSRENILKAKLEILEGLKGNTVIINNDNDLLCEWAQNNKDKALNIVTYGINNKKSTYVAQNIQSFEDKSIYNLDGQNITVPVGGEHFVLNSLCAIAVGKYFEIPMNKIVEGINELDLTKKRMEINKTKIGAIIINDTYNANYDSMKAAINYLEKIEGRRKIAVLGDMLELGNYSEKLHRMVGDEIKNIDILITVGNEAKYIAQNAKTKNIFQYDSNEKAIDKIKSIIQPEDAILLKASNSMNFNEIVENIKTL